MTAIEGVALLAEEGEGRLVGTLVRRNYPPRHDRAVLYLHGWNDYFFQSHLADEWDALGYDFYALDLRRYGRSMHDNELPGYIDDLDDYDLELDAAVEQAYKGKRKISWMEIYAGEKATRVYGENVWLPDETLAVAKD